MAREFVGNQLPLAICIARGLTRNHDEAEDLAQEALRRALRHWRLLDARRPQGAWLRKVMHNALIDDRKKSKRARVMPLEASPREDIPSFAELLPDGGLTPLEELERRELAFRVRRTLGLLRGRYSEALRLCYMEGESYEQVARVLGVPLGTLRSSLSRARVEFRRQWALAETYV